ncbi:hypothetical protein NQ318_010072 [Aromia moschata]|uniref:Uncharacterized protein n=1 Tax=Aromia moschata TaxID=1265417 RepID=A0AAV8YD96_9CUCU|nr:hypothetical protein NQ318_010072 [Aromia moschata]
MPYVKAAGLRRLTTPRVNREAEGLALRRRPQAWRRLIASTGGQRGRRPRLGAKAAGLRRLIAPEGGDEWEYITACPHDDAVNILRNAGDLVVLTVKHYKAATPFLQKQDQIFAFLGRNFMIFVEDKDSQQTDSNSDEKVPLMKVSGS